MFPRRAYRSLLCFFLFVIFHIEGSPSSSIKKTDSKKSKSFSFGLSSESKSSLDKLRSQLFLGFRRPFTNRHKFAKKGDKFLNKKDYREAIRYYDEAIKKKPSELSYRRIRGDCYLKLRDVEKALVDFRKVVSENPDSKDDRRKLSQALYVAGLYAEAVDEIITVSDFDELIELGDRLFADDKMEQAILCYTAAVRKSDSDTKILEVGHKLFSVGKYNEAILIYSEAIFIKFPWFKDTNSPNRTHFYKFRGKCLAEIGDFDAAISDFRTALEMDPKNEEWCYFFIRKLFDFKKFDQEAERSLISSGNNLLLAILADELSFMKQFNEAIPYYNKLIEEKPEEASFFRKRARCYSEMNDFNSAEVDLRAAVRMDPSRKNVVSLIQTLVKFEKFHLAIREALAHNEIVELVKLGNLLFAMGRFDEAERCYNAAIEKLPLEAAFRKIRGKFYAEMNDFDLAKADFEVAVELVPADEESCHFLIRSLLQSGDELNEIMERAFAMNENALFLTSLINEFLERKKIDEAIRCYTEMIKRNSSEPSLLKLRGNLYLQTENVGKAIDDFTDALQMDPKNKEYFDLLMQTLIDSGKLTDAVDVAIAFDNIHEILKLGNMLTSKREFRAATHCFSIAIKKYPLEATYYKLRGKCFVNLKELDKAKSDFEVYLEENPTDSEIRLLFLQALFDCEKYDEAVDESLKLDHIQIYENLAEKLIDKQRWEEAKRCYDEMIRINPSVRAYYEKRALCYERLVNLIAAVVDHKAALDFDRHHKRNFQLLIQALLKLDRFEEAVKETMARGDVDEILNLGDKLYSLKQLEYAVQCYSVAIERRPGNPRLLRIRALAYKNSNKHELAIADLETTLEKIQKSSFPGLSKAECQFDLIESLLKIGERRKAEDGLKYLNDEQRARYESIRQQIMGNEEAKEEIQEKEKVVATESPPENKDKSREAEVEERIS